MNELIRELENQCWGHRVDGALIDGQLHFDTQKFAELIVKECLQQIDKIRDDCEKDDESQQALGADWAGLAVARHFGIQE